MFCLYNTLAKSRYLYSNIGPKYWQRKLGHIPSSSCSHIIYIYTIVPVFRGLCDQGTPAVSGQYNDVRGDFQYKLTLDQGTPANADADRHLFVIFAPQPGDSALFILFFITLGRKRYHTGSQTLSNLFANAHSIPQTDVNSRSCIPRKIMTPPADVHLGISEGYSDAR